MPDKVELRRTRTQTCDADDLPPRIALGSDRIQPTADVFRGSGKQVTLPFTWKGVSHFYIFPERLLTAELVMYKVPPLLLQHTVEPCMMLVDWMPDIGSRQWHRTRQQHLSANFSASLPCFALSHHNGFVAGELCCSTSSTCTLYYPPVSLHPHLHYLILHRFVTPSTAAVATQKYLNQDGICSYGAGGEDLRPDAAGL